MNASLLSSENGIGNAVQGSGMGVPTLQNRGIGTATQSSGMGVPTLQERGIGNAQQFFSQPMMASGSPNSRGVDTSLSDNMINTVGTGMGNNLRVLADKMQNVNEIYGSPDTLSVDDRIKIMNGEMTEAQADKILADSQLPFRDKGGSGFFRSLDPIDMAFRMAVGGDTTQNSIDAHRANKNSNFGDGLMGYKDENMLNQDGTTYIPVSDMPNGYHFKSGKDAGNMARGDLTLGGIPLALLGHAYQQGTGLLKMDGSYGRGARLQASDNARGIAASGNAPALQGIFDRMDAGRARDEVIKQRIADGTFVPGKKAQAYNPPKETVADRKGYTPKPAAKTKVKVDYNKNKPVVVKKTKPTPRGPQPVKVTRTTGSRGGRGNVGARRRLTGGR